MSENPYEASATMADNALTQPTRWMIVVGCVLISIAAICLFVMVAMMMLSFNELAVPNSNPNPSKLAARIDWAMIPALAATPLGLLGIIFVIIGFVRRRPVEIDSNHSLV